jgi:hypothetical protein
MLKRAAARRLGSDRKDFIRRPKCRGSGAGATRNYLSAAGCEKGRGWAVGRATGGCQAGGVTGDDDERDRG